MGTTRPTNTRPLSGRRDNHIPVISPCPGVKRWYGGQKTVNIRGIQIKRKGEQQPHHITLGQMVRRGKVAQLRFHLLQGSHIGHQGKRAGNASGLVPQGRGIEKSRQVAAFTGFQSDFIGAVGGDGNHGGLRDENGPVGVIHEINRPAAHHLVFRIAQHADQRFVDPNGVPFWIQFPIAFRRGVDDGPVTQFPHAQFFLHPLAIGPIDDDRQTSLPGDSGRHAKW